MVTDVGRGWISHIACRMELRAVAPLRLSLSFTKVLSRRRCAAYVCNRRKNVTTRGSGSPARTRTEWDTHRTGATGPRDRAHDPVDDDRSPSREPRARARG